jgi:predicted transcriptional regulator
MAKVPPSVVIEREVRAWQMARDGHQQPEIAAELGVTQQAVSKILKRISTRAIKRLNGAEDERRALHTARLEHIYREAIEAWERSKLPRKKSSSKKLRVGGASPLDLAKLEEGVSVGGVEPTTVREEMRNEASTTDGDFLFLQTALQADGELRKLWGLNAPKKLDILDKRRPLEQLSDDELARRAAENAALLAAEGAK